MSHGEQPDVNPHRELGYGDFAQDGVVDEGGVFGLGNYLRGLARVGISETPATLIGRTHLPVTPGARGLLDAIDAADQGGIPGLSDDDDIIGYLSRIPELGHTYMLRNELMRPDIDRDEFFKLNIVERALVLGIRMAAHNPKIEDRIGKSVWESWVVTSVIDRRGAESEVWIREAHFAQEFIRKAFSNAPEQERILTYVFQKGLDAGQDYRDNKAHYEQHGAKNTAT